MQWLAVCRTHESSYPMEDLLPVIHTALAWTPHVCTEGDDTVLLEVASTLRLWGGLQALQQRLEQALASLEMGTFIVDHAPTATAAGLFVRAHPHRKTSTPSPQSWLRRLDELPLAVLRHGQPHAQAFAGMGLHTVADLRALPRAGVSRRWGPALLLEIDRARGDAPDPRTWRQLRPVFDERLELPARAETVQQILQGAQRLLIRLMAWATAQHARVAGFALYLHSGRVQDHAVIEVALAQPSSDREHWLFMLRERLMHSPVTAAALELRLRCDAWVRTPAPNAELFPTSASEKEGLSRMLERLQARLGPQAVRTLASHADHRPERATTWQPVDSRTVHAACVDSLLLSPTVPHLSRPVWLWSTPQPLKEQRGCPWLDGQPLELLSGPERVESGWWDNAPALRDYFIAQTHDGSLVWIYRTRMPQWTEQPHLLADSGWFLHGRFA